MKKLIIYFGIYGVLVQIILTLLISRGAEEMVAVKMLWSLIIIWIVICGGLMYFYRDKFKILLSRIKLPFILKFVLFSTILALIEEGIAVGINYYFYLKTGVSVLTISTNYFEVVFKHSVVALIPLFIIFGILLKKINPTPSRAFLVFGLIGVFAEITLGGLLSLLQAGMWIFVYGLMIYLPYYTSYEISKN